MARFEPATDAELEEFVNQQKCQNTQKSTDAASILLNQYKREAFNNEESYELMERTDLVRLLK